MSDEQVERRSQTVYNKAKRMGHSAFDLRSVISLVGMGTGLFVAWLNMSNSIVELKTDMASVKKGLDEQMKGYTIQFQSSMQLMNKMDERYSAEILEIRSEIKENRIAIQRLRR